MVAIAAASSMVDNTPLQKRQKILQQRKSLPIATGNLHISEILQNLHIFMPDHLHYFMF